MAAKYQGNKPGNISSPATDTAVQSSFKRSSSLDGVSHNVHHGEGFKKGAGEIVSPATDGIKRSNVKNLPGGAKIS